MSYRKLSLMLLSAVALAGLLYGCGSSSKEGGGTAAGVANVGDSACRQCHSAVVDPLTGVGIIAQYDSTSPHRDSPHANNGNGCEACHGGGAQHNGVGPIPVVNPFDGDGTRCAECHKGKYQTNAPTKFADSLHAKVVLEKRMPCLRCHTNEGAVLGATYGLTGSGDVMDNAAYQGAVLQLPTDYTAITCESCHEHGGGLRPVKGRDADGNLVYWNPGKTAFANNQVNLCTSCHTYKTYDGSMIMGSGSEISMGTLTPFQTAEAGHHETSWYRIIATTHANNIDNPAAGGISGYVIRESGDKPCFDCHGHEAKTNTSKTNPNDTDYNIANETIFTEWAKSGHAGKLLQVKMDAISTSTGTIVDVAMSTVVDDTTAPAWNYYDWSNGSNDPLLNRQACQRCHTATGASNYLSGPATYDDAANDFSHLYNANYFNKRRGTYGGYWSTGTKAATQRELLYCWGCHQNTSAEKGGLRNPGAITASYKFNGANAQFPDADSSNVCIACHSGRESGESITSIPTGSFTNTGFKNSHYMAAAGLMYVKIGFTAFTAPTATIGSSTTTYGETLTSTEDGGALRSTHRKFGSTAMIGDHQITASDTQFLSGGPCVTCHLSKSASGGEQRHHTLEIDANAFNNVCVNCHDEENGTQLTDENFEDLFLKDQSAVFQDALGLIVSQLTNTYGIDYDPSHYPYFYESGTTQKVMDWTRSFKIPGGVDGMKMMGACFNLNLLTRDPAAYAHARTYTRRLVYDTIDFLDNQQMDLSTVKTAKEMDGTKYKEGASAYDVNTTPAMTFIKGYSHNGGAWNAIERP